MSSGQCQPAVFKKTVLGSIPARPGYVSLLNPQRRHPAPLCGNIFNRGRQPTRAAFSFSALTNLSGDLSKRFLLFFLFFLQDPAHALSLKDTRAPSLASSFSPSHSVLRHASSTWAVRLCSTSLLLPPAAEYMASETWNNRSYRVRRRRDATTHTVDLHRQRLPSRVRPRSLFDASLRVYSVSLLLVDTEGCTKSGPRERFHR